MKGILGIVTVKELFFFKFNEDLTDKRFMMDECSTFIIG